MAVEFKNSETKDNLMRAFAGESQARNRYTFAAGQANREKQQAIAKLFIYTANQEKEHAEVYKNFGDKAKEEGFLNVANAFHMIAKIEKMHGDRFGRFAEWLEENKLHVSDVKTGWICLNCGHVYEGQAAPEQCPVCQHDKGYFIRLELSPFTE